MKKFLAVLLALTLVLAFTACGGGDEEESKVDSSVESVADASSEDAPAESSEEAPAESSEEAPAESSEEAPAESSEEAPAESSEEAPAESSEEVSVEVITTAEKTNYALNKTYEAIKNGGEECTYLTDSTYCPGDYSDDGTKLTDGKIATVEEMAAIEPVMYCIDGTTVQYTGTGASYDVYFDLEACYGDINSIVLKNVRNGEPYGDNRGVSDLFFVYTSNDNVNWTRVDLEDAIRTEVEGAPGIKGVNTGENLVNQCVDVTLNFSAAATGRYVRVNFSSNGITASCPDGVYIVQLDEIEIWN